MQTDHDKEILELKLKINELEDRIKRLELSDNITQSRRDLEIRNRRR